MQSTDHAGNGKSTDAPDAPLALADGEELEQTFKVFASSHLVRRYWLDGFERVSWECQVLDEYDIVMSTELSCAGLQQGVERSREVTERERSDQFDGYVDLGADHAGWLAALGATQSASSTPSKSSTRGMLVVRFDNSYSFWTPKTVRLRLKKVGGVARDDRIDVNSCKDAIRQCRVDGQWERALRLLSKCREVCKDIHVEIYNDAMDVCGAVGRWTNVIEILDTMRSDGHAPSAVSYSLAISAYENLGLADRALQLMDEMYATEGVSAASDMSALRDEVDAENVEWLHSILQEALTRCPVDAFNVQAHLKAAQVSFQKYTEGNLDVHAN